MNRIQQLLALIMGLITSFFIWSYTQRANLDYNVDGKHFSLEDGVVYHKQAIEAYGFIALLGVIFTGLFMNRLLRKKTRIVKKPNCK